MGIAQAFVKTEKLALSLLVFSDAVKPLKKRLFQLTENLELNAFIHMVTKIVINVLKI